MEVSEDVRERIKGELSSCGMAINPNNEDAFIKGAYWMLGKLRSSEVDGDTDESTENGLQMADKSVKYPVITKYGYERCSDGGAVDYNVFVVRFKDEYNGFECPFVLSYNKHDCKWSLIVDGDNIDISSLGLGDLDLLRIQYGNWIGIKAYRKFLVTQFLCDRELKDKFYGIANSMDKFYGKYVHDITERMEKDLGNLLVECESIIYM